MDNRALGKRIQKYRNEKNLTAEKLAEIVGLSTSMIREIERGNKLPSLPSLVCIANALNVSSDELLCESITKSTYVIDREIQCSLKNLSKEDLSFINSIIDCVTIELQRRHNKNNENIL